MAAATLQLRTVKQLPFQLIPMLQRGCVLSLSLKPAKGTYPVPLSRTSCQAGRTRCATLPLCRSVGPPVMAQVL